MRVNGNHVGGKNEKEEGFLPLLLMGMFSRPKHDETHRLVIFQGDQGKLALPLFMQGRRKQPGLCWPVHQFLLLLCVNVHFNVKQINEAKQRLL